MPAFAWAPPRNLTFRVRGAEVSGVVEMCEERAEEDGRTSLRVTLIATAATDGVTAGGRPVAPGDRVVLWCRGRHKRALTDAGNAAGGLRAGSRLTAALSGYEDVARYPGSPRKVMAYEVGHGQAQQAVS